MANTSNTQSGVPLVKQLYGAFATGDVPTVLGGFHQNVEWISAEGAPYPGTFRGPEAILTNVFARLGAEWDGYRAEPAEYLDAGENIVVLGRYSGKYKATGRSMSAAFAHVWTVRDGKVTRFRQYTDTRKMAEVL